MANSVKSRKSGTDNAAVSGVVKSTKSISATIESGKLLLSFGNGETLTIDPAALSQEIRDMALLHGLKQKLVDAAAISRNVETGKPATISDKVAAVREVYERITSKDGTWNKIRESGVGSGNDGGVLLRALIQITGRTKEDLAQWLETKSPEQKRAMRSNPKIAPVIAEMQASRNAKVDTTSMLAELGV